jgi:ABC-2 type transport system permease protein
VVTNVVLQASPFILTVTTVTMVGVTFAVTAMALGLGALYPNYDTENVAEIPTSFGGLLFMMAAVIYLAGIVVLEGWPIYLYLQANLASEGASPSTIPLILGLSGAVLLTALAVWLPLRAGVKRVRSLDA